MLHQRRTIGKDNSFRFFVELTIFSLRRSNPAEILQYFSPMKMKVGRLYDELQRATALGKVREVLKIEEKLKLLRCER